jgi:uncharacterized protein YjbI with pentapeptide repeats
MADPKLLRILSQGVTEWNQWWKANAGDSGFDLTNANLESADLSNAIFTFANLNGANLSNSRLKNTVFNLAALNGADLNSASLEGAGGYGVRLRGANLKAARLDGVRFKAADLTEANLEGASFAEADVSQAIFYGANLADVDLINAKLFGTRFWKTDLRRVKLHGAFLYGANFEGSDLTEAALGFTTFSNCSLAGAKGLETITHESPSSIGVDTIFYSRNKIPDVFLRGTGLSDAFITHIPALIASIEPIQFYSCFISYSSADQNFAERLHEDLQAKGVRVWFAPHDLPIGAKIRPAIDESIRLHDKLLLVLSETSVSSQWVEQEVETALAREREQEGRAVLFPIRIDDIVIESKAGWPALLKNTRNVGDFTHWKEHDSYQKALAKLLRDLKAGELCPDR